MDFLQMKQGDLEQIWAKINENQFIFHPSLSPYGQIDIGPFLHQRFSRKPIEINVQNLLIANGTINFRSLIQVGVDGGDSRNKDDRVPAHVLPDFTADIQGAEPCRI